MRALIGWGRRRAGGGFHLLLPVLLSWLAACQPLPHPFADNRPSRAELIGDMKDSLGITVARVSGAPPSVGDSLAEAMATALCDADIPATTQGRNQMSYVLAGAATARPLDAGLSAVEVQWQLRDASGNPVGSHAERIDGHTTSWAEAPPALVTALARASAPAIAKLIQGEVPTAAPDDGRPTIVVRQVEGAPGDGAQSLARAMAAALRGNPDIRVTDKPNPRGLIVAGRVTVGPPDKGNQDVKVIWALLRPDGSQVGEVDQQNAVPAGSLDRFWGDVAFAVATAAADGVLALVAAADSTGPTPAKAS